MSTKLKFIFTIIFIWLLTISICLILRVEPTVVCNGETYIGIFVSAIGVGVAFIIGHQIFNALDVKSDLRNQRNDNQNFIDRVQNSLAASETANNEYRQQIEQQLFSLKQSVTSSEDNIKNISASVNEGIAVLDALRIADDTGNISNYLNAFTKMQEALLSGLDYESNNYRFILDNMRKYAKRICTNSFGGGFSHNRDGFYYCTPNSNYSGRSLKDVLENEILPPIKDIETKIKEHPKFSCISHDYSILMEKFYNRVNESSSRFFPKSLEEFENF